jgi:hypothetical protein
MSYKGSKMKQPSKLELKNNLNKSIHYLIQLKQVIQNSELNNKNEILNFIKNNETN